MSPEYDPALSEATTDDVVNELRRRAGPYGFALYMQQSQEPKPHIWRWWSSAPAKRPARAIALFLDAIQLVLNDCTKKNCAEPTMVAPLSYIFGVLKNEVAKLDGLSR